MQAPGHTAAPRLWYTSLNVQKFIFFIFSGCCYIRFSAFIRMSEENQLICYHVLPLTIQYSIWRRFVFVKMAVFLVRVCASSYEILSNSVDISLRYGDFATFKMEADG